MTQTIVSLKKGIDILSLVGAVPGGLTALGISEHLDIPLSTTYRYLSILVEEELLHKDQDSVKYKLGLVPFLLANTVTAQKRLVDIGLPQMEVLAKHSRETVLLTVISGWKGICLEKVESPNLIKLSLDRGSSLPLHAGASSKILLAYQKESFVQALIEEVGLPKYTENTITDPDLMREELERIRRQSFAYSDQEADLGARAIAAPIYDHTGNAVAGLSLAGPKDRINDKNIPQLIELVKETAINISQQGLGYSPPT